MAVAVVISLAVWATCVTMAIDQSDRRSGTTIPPLGAATAEILESWFPSEVSHNRIPGAAAAVVASDTVIWERAYGTLGDSAPQAVDNQTLFCVRSISKSVTALAVLIAVQDGLLDLDSSIVHYLPNFMVNSRFEGRPESRITIRHMLAHWGGFTHDPPLIDYGSNPKEGFDRYVSAISDTWLRYPVGYRWSYSNYGYDLAARVLESQTGLAFNRYVKEKVLLPIGMTASTFSLEDVESNSNRALGHTRDADSVRLHFPEKASAGLFSNINDMGRYAQFHLNSGSVNGVRILRDDLMEEYHRIQFSIPGQRSGYTLGLFRSEIGNTYYIHHAGGGRGFRSLLAVYPDLGYGVVLLTNSNDHALTERPGRNEINEPVLSASGDPAPSRLSFDGLIPVDPQHPEIAAILGRYDGRGGLEIRKNTGVIGIWWNGAQRFDPVTMYLKKGVLTGFRGRQQELRFLHTVHGQPKTFASISRHDGSVTYHVLNDSPVDARGPGSARWQEYVGDYDLYWETERMRTVSVTVRNGHFYFGERKCSELKPGLFFSNDGEALDFRTEPPRWANLRLEKLDE